MYLKALQVVGFKSFADRTVVQFDPGVTAVVGPNGCGKSNVLDAIRWVLGEQSAKALRGGSMQDVIFSGTDRRKPLGMAEVSLTFADCEQQLGMEFHEVTITRRVFRDGQSEYELNKTPCRLKDIHQLFMDTGIGRTAYSIMEQGKIDQILSSKPEDRRAIFEEAAGITKYKSQKKEALRKLEATDANLLRLADIIAEVERQIKSLQRQAAKARRYQERLEELRSLETRLARRKFDAASVEIRELAGEVEAARAEQDELGRMLRGREEEIRADREALAAIDARLLELRDQAAEARAGLDRAAQRRATNEGRVAEFTDLRNRCEAELAGTEEKIRIQEEELARLSELLRQSEGARDATRAEAERLQEEAQVLNARMHALENDRADREEAVQALTEVLAEVREQMAALDLQQKNYLFRVEKLQQEQQAIGAKLAEAGTRLQEHRVAQASREEALAGLLARTREHREEEKAAEAAVREAREKLDMARRDLHALEARQDAIEKLLAAPEAAPPLLQEAVDGALAARLRGTLSEHFTAKAGYEGPLALLLGDAVRTVLVEDRASVETILRRGDEGEGKAAGPFGLNLLPLDLARPVPPANSHPAHALAYLEADALAAPLLASLLADAYIVDDLLGAYAIKVLKPEAVIATQNGELVTRGGVICIGTRDGASVAVLTRQNELRQIEGQLGPARTAAAAGEGELAAAEAVLAAAREKTEAGQESVRAAEISLAESRQEQRALERAVADLEREQSAAAREREKLEAQDDTDASRAGALREKLGAAEAEIAAGREAIAGLAVQLNEMAGREGELSRRITEAKVLLATQQEQYEGSQRQREPVANRLLELRELVEIRTREAADYAARIDQARLDIAQAEADQAELAARAEELQARGATEMEARTAAQAAIDAKDAGLREHRLRLQELQASQSGREVALEKQKMQLDALRDRIRSSYQLELEDLPPLTEEDAAADWPAIESQVAERRSQIDAMGPVNLDAITEYEELEQRFQFLTTQQQDLVNAKEDLLKTIQHINQTTKKLFSETFEKIKENFHEMFTALFGGGKADLILLDAENPLDCGIDVVAKPPGKQLQSITLLSGGEKTMTAVALLFAIYMVKPSPFCVLDEMDAPLDESNISRFIKMLDRFVGQSQFVVITHNKRTISRADALYGVTMEEHGVSKLVSVRLSKDSARPRGHGSDPVPAAPHTPGIAEDPLVPSIAESFGKTGELRV